MNVYELKIVLSEMGIPSNAYTFDEEYPNEKYCLLKKGLLWEFYYSEKGSKTGIKRFVSEDKACEYAYSKLKNL